MRMCRINQGMGRGGGKFPGDISINLGPWNELPSSTPGRFIIHPPTHLPSIQPPTHPPTNPSIQPLPPGPSVKCCGEYKDELVKHTLSLASSISETKDADPWIYASLKGTGEVPYHTTHLLSLPFHSQGN